MRLTSRRIALGICAYFVILAICYASITPALEAPDELAHFLYIHNLLEERRLPVLESRDVVFKSLATQRHQPPLYYLIGAALISGTRRSDVGDYLQLNPFAAIGTISANNQNGLLHRPFHTGDTALAVWILRLYSIALATVTLWFVYNTGRLAFGRESIGLLAMLLVASMPGFMFIGSSINNDNLVTMFYAAGVYYCIRLWKQRAIANRDILIISLVLAGAALSKLTGLTLFGVVYFSLLIGVARRCYTWRRAARLVIFSLLISGVLAGWWYLRNQILYGDPLALNATAAIWTRGGSHVSLGELYGVWESFWMILGQFNIRGPDWFYVYVVLITVIGAAGMILLTWRDAARRYESALLLVVCVVVVASLLAATRQINVSQGRILFPGLVAFAPLMVGGWYAILKRRAGSLLVLPLLVVEILAPATTLLAAYTPLAAFTSLPVGIRSLSVRSETLHLLGYQLAADTVAPGDTVHLWVYFAGQDAANPHLFVKAVYPDTSVVEGVDLYPGMAPTAALLPEESGAIYRARVSFRLNATPQASPFQLRLQIGWSAGARFLPLFDTYTNQTLHSLIVPGPTLIDGSQPSAVPSVATNINFGDQIHLSGYSVSQLTPGKPVTLTLVWRCLSRIDGDFRSAVGVLDANNNVIVQADGIPNGYPTSAWRPGPDFADTRQFTLPSDLKAGTYAVYIGWYNSANGDRLPMHGSGTSALNLFEIPFEVH